jgi:transcriptional regulator with XRE-family HTH domain
MSEITLDLRTRRLRAGKTFDQLARDARCSTATARLLENGWRPGKSEALKRIEAALASYENDPSSTEAPDAA